MIHGTNIASSNERCCNLLTHLTFINDWLSSIDNLQLVERNSCLYFSRSNSVQHVEWPFSTFNMAWYTVQQFVEQQLNICWSTNMVIRVSCIGLKARHHPKCCARRYHFLCWISCNTKFTLECVYEQWSISKQKQTNATSFGWRWAFNSGSSLYMQMTPFYACVQTASCFNKWFILVYPLIGSFFSGKISLVYSRNYRPIH